MTFPGPADLGRSVVIGPHDDIPPGFDTALLLTIDEAVLEEPADLADRVHRLWRRREPFVARLEVDTADLVEPEVESRAPHELPADFDLARTRLRYLLLANTYWAVGTEPQWQLTDLAARLGCTPSGVADVTTPDGRDLWLDGGPRAAFGDLPVLHRDTLELGRLEPPPSRDLELALAPDQRAAVEHGSGPARIIAPAGSGKTRVLTARLRELLEGRGYETEIVTALAYNNRAAAEMRERTEGLGAHIRTLHALGQSIINRLERRRLIDDAEVRERMQRLVTLPRVQNQDPLAPYIEALSEVRLGLRDPADVEEERDDLPGFTDAYHRYRNGLLRDGAMDFDEQIHGAIEVLLTEPRIRAQVQRTCRYLLVDEFQDLTPAMLLLVRLVSAPGWDVFGVGDDDQVIYGYAGATPGYLLGYAELFPEAQAHALEVNYRCAPGVVEAAATLLSHNRQRVDKVIRPGPGREAADGDLVVESVATTGLAERAVDVIQAWLADAAAPSFAVLGRVNSVLMPVQVALTEYGIGHSRPLGRNVLERTALRGALAWLRVGLDPERMSSRDVEEVLKRPSRGLTTVLRERLRSRPRWNVTQFDGFADHLSATQSGRLDEFTADIDALCALITDGADTAACLAFIRDDIGLDEAASLLDRRAMRGSAASSHSDDLDALAQLAPLHPDPGTFERWLREAIAVDRDDAGVLLSTVHRVKGLEWDRVLVIGATDSLWPHHLADDLEEERRILHVAITRSRETTVVLAPADRPSPFLDELDKPWVPGSPPLRLAPTVVAPAGRAAEPAASADPVLFAALRAWRLERSRADAVPAFIVADNKTLEAIAAAAPRTMRDLARVRGIGPKKLEDYGEELLAVVEATLS